MSLVDRAWQVQINWEQKRKQRKKDKEQRYRVFLASPPRPLPSYSSLVRWRNIIALVIFCVMLVSSLMMTVFLEYAIIPPFNMIHVVCVLLALIFSGFAIMFDYVIYKRWGNTHSFMEW